MRPFLVVISIVALLALNWAALHDILQGEPDVRLEWVVVALSLVLVAEWGIFRWRKRAA
jgi:hypothetical protein